MITNNGICYNSTRMYKLLINYNLTRPKLWSKTNFIPTDIYDELLSISNANGPLNKICFKFLTNKTYTNPSPKVQLKLKLISSLSRLLVTIPYIVALLMGIPFLIYVFTSNLFKDLFLLSLLFLICYLSYGLISIFVYEIATKIVNHMRQLTPIRHPHLLYLTQIHADGIPTGKLMLVFKDNESFYGKRYNIQLKIIINSDGSYDKKHTTSQIRNVITTIVYAQKVEFV